MGHGANQLVVLNEWTPRHSLKNTARLFQELRVCDVDDEVPTGAVLIRMNTLDLHIIILRLCAGNGAEQSGRAGFHLLRVSSGNQGEPMPIDEKLAVNAAAAVMLNDSPVLFATECALQFTGLSGQTDCQSSDGCMDDLTLR